MRQLFVALSVFAVVLVSARNAAAQTDDCSFPDTSTIEGLIADVFLTADNPTPASITIVNISYVCQMSGMFRDTYRGISLLAKYECGGSGNCPVEGVVEKSQFDFSCLNGVWIAQVQGSADFIFTRTPNSTFDTPLRTDCSFCINPLQLELQGSSLMSDELTHCVACAECNAGAMKCFGTGVNRCCNFYNPSDGRCLQECQADRLVTDNFDCTAFARFTRTQYVFSEDQGTGSVMVEGSDGVAVNVSGGPPLSQEFVRISGSAVDESITSLPATVTFNINDDDVALEANEVYFLTLTSDDPDVLIQQKTTQIMITDKDRVNSRTLWRKNRSSTSLLAGTVEFGNGSVSPFIDYALDIQNDDVALEDSEVFRLVLGSPSDSRVQIGGRLEDVNVTFYATATITIVDDELAQLSFLTNLFVFPESRQSALVFVILRNKIVAGRSVTVTVVEEDRGNMRFVVQSISLPDVNLTFNSTSATAQFITPIYTDDLVGLEDTESLDFVLKAVSDPAQIDFSGRIPRANVTVLDNEDVTAMIDGPPTRRVNEGDSILICVSKDIVSVRGVNFDLRPQPQSAGSSDYSPSTPQSGTLPTYPNAQECITFSALADNVIEGSETFTVSLTVQRLPRGTGELLTTNEEVFITIVDTMTTPTTPTPTTPTPTIPTVPPIVEGDTVIGDPLFTVPILSAQPSRLLCYEIRGAVNEYFNFISDACVSVNAHYVQRTLATETRRLHVIDEIAIRAVDNVGNCINIRVNRNDCSTFVNNSPITGDYSSNGIRVTLSNNRAVVNVPNCNDTDLEFSVGCQVLNGIDMLRFEVERGLNLRKSSHGLLGQFWNVAIDVDEFTGDLRDGKATDNVYIVTVKPEGTALRQFPAWLEAKAWDNRRTCLYAGNQNGGTVFELKYAHDSLIEGFYTDYITDGPYSTHFKFSHFESNRCS